MNVKILDDLLETLTTLPMEGIVERAADRKEDLMISLNVKQMQAGIKSDGNPIEPPYKARTVRIKEKKGQPTDRVTLRDTGDFQNAERVRRFPRRYELYSQDSKDEALTSKYGLDIHGLTDESLGIVCSAMKPLMIKDLRNIIVIKR